MLDELPGNGSQTSAGAVTTIRLLILTGSRKNEIMTLPWEHVDLDRAEMRIVDGKTGSRRVHLSPSAVDVLKALPRVSGNPWVVPGARPGTHMTDIDGAWQSIRTRAGLHDVRIHDMRHSWASVAAMNSVDMVTVAKLLGHALVETTAGYLRPPRGRAPSGAAEKAGAAIAEAMIGDTAARASRRGNATPATGNAGSRHYASF